MLVIVLSLTGILQMLLLAGHQVGLVDGVGTGSPILAEVNQLVPQSLLHIPSNVGMVAGHQLASKVSPLM